RPCAVARLLDSLLVMQRNTLILGATSAIAAEVAKVCARRGDRLFLVGRDPQKLEPLVALLGAAVVDHECCDLNQFDQAEPRVARWLAQLGGLDCALIAHGYLGDQARSELEFEYAQQIMQTNFVSAVSLLMP